MSRAHDTPFLTGLVMTCIYVSTSEHVHEYMGQYISEYLDMSKGANKGEYWIRNDSKYRVNIGTYRHNWESGPWRNAKRFEFRICSFFSLLSTQ